MKTQMTYTEFKTKRANYQSTVKGYLQDLEASFENSTKLAYKMYLKGRIPAWAK